MAATRALGLLLALAALTARGDAVRDAGVASLMRAASDADADAAVTRVGLDAPDPKAKQVCGVEATARGAPSSSDHDAHLHAPPGDLPAALLSALVVQSAMLGLEGASSHISQASVMVVVQGGAALGTCRGDVGAWMVGPPCPMPRIVHCHQPYAMHAPYAASHTADHLDPTGRCLGYINHHVCNRPASGYICCAAQQEGVPGRFLE